MRATVLRRHECTPKPELEESARGIELHVCQRLQMKLLSRSKNEVIKFSSTLK